MDEFAVAQLGFKNASIFRLWGGRPPACEFRFCSAGFQPAGGMPTSAQPYSSSAGSGVFVAQPLLLASRNERAAHFRWITRRWKAYFG